MTGALWRVYKGAAEACSTWGYGDGGEAFLHGVMYEYALGHDILKYTLLALPAVEPTTCQ